MKLTATKKRSRLIVKDGQRNFVLSIKEVALLYVKERSVFVVTNDSKKYQFNKSLTHLEKELDDSIFFRTNRHSIVNIDFIKSFTVFECNKLKVEMHVDAETEIVVSQETAPLFKSWLCES
ncbi:MAG TPA: LytTR family DNA-binding domain-containing protein [Hanamia sp.]|nr:LytTR family DNA-binding domain-containing protein [Hanamia sp.]